MRKAVYACLIVLVMAVAGCTRPFASGVNAGPIPNDTIKDDIMQIISEKHEDIAEFVFVTDFDDNEDNDGKDIVVHLYDDVRYLYLGTYIKSITNICRKYAEKNDIEFENLTVSVFQGDEIAVIFLTDFKDIYLLSDYRSGESTDYLLESLDELVEIFPAMDLAEFFPDMEAESDKAFGF